MHIKEINKEKKRRKEEKKSSLYSLVVLEAKNNVKTNIYNSQLFANNYSMSINHNLKEHKEDMFYLSIVIFVEKVCSTLKR